MHDRELMRDYQNDDAADTATVAGMKSSNQLGAIGGFCAAGLVVSIFLLNTYAMADQAVNLGARTLWG